METIEGNEKMVKGYRQPTMRRRTVPSTRIKYSTTVDVFRRVVGEQAGRRKQENRKVMVEL